MSASQKITPENLAILGGEGRIPDYIAEKFSKITMIKFGQNQPNKLGELGDILDSLRSQNIDTLCLIGAIKRPSMLSLVPSKRTRTLIKKYGFSLSGGDDTLLKRIKKALMGEGFNIIGAHSLCPELLVEGGVLTTAQVILSQSDLKNALQLCKEYGLEDKGQSIIVNNGNIIDKEDKAGSDALILRNKQSNAILVKVSKPQQDLDLDMPTIGLQTIENCIKADIRTIILEAGKVLFIDQKEAIALANTHNLSITGINHEP